jgi:hypothetical protein
MQSQVADKSVRETIFVSETPEIFEKFRFYTFASAYNNKTDFEKKFRAMRPGEHIHNLQDKLKDLPEAHTNWLCA